MASKRSKAAVAAAPLLVLVLLPLLLAAAAPPNASVTGNKKKAVQLSSSVMIFSNTDLDSPNPKASRCGKLLRAAASHGSKSVNIVSLADCSFGSALR
jgi:hypothetical protein